MALEVGEQADGLPFKGVESRIEGDGPAVVNFSPRAINLHDVSLLIFEVSKTVGISYAAPVMITTAWVRCCSQ
jgi:hypothetical protein